MIVVGIETSGRRGSVALTRDGQLVRECVFQDKFSHGRDLVRSLEAMCSEHGIGPKDIGLVAVSDGPGSFTGLRVGAACAKALAWALGIPIVGVPSLEVLAQNAADRSGAICPVRDARREKVYGALFTSDGNGAMRCEWPTRLFAPEDLVRELPEETFVFGDGARAYADLFSRFSTCGDELDVGRASAVAKLGLERFLNGQRDDPIALAPKYYRRIEAEEKWGA